MASTNLIAGDSDLHCALAKSQQEVVSLKEELLQKQFLIRELQGASTAGDSIERLLKENRELKATIEDTETRFRKYVDLDTSTVASNDASDEPYLDLLKKKDEDIKKLTDANNQLGFDQARLKKDNSSLKYKCEQLVLKTTQCFSPQKAESDPNSELLRQDNARLQSEKAVLIGTVAKLKDDFSSLESKHSAQTSRLNEELTKLQGSVSFLTTERDSLKADAAKKRKALVDVRDKFRQWKQKTAKDKKKITGIVENGKKEINQLFTNELGQLSVKCRSLLAKRSDSTCAAAPFIDEGLKQAYENQLDKIVKEKKDLQNKIEANIKDSKTAMEKLKKGHNENVEKLRKRLDLFDQEAKRKAFENERMKKLNAEQYEKVLTEVAQYRVMFMEGLSSKDAKGRFLNFVGPQSDRFKSLLQENGELRKKLRLLDTEERLAQENTIKSVQNEIKHIVEAAT